MAVGSPCKICHSSTPQGTESISYEVDISQLHPETGKEIKFIKKEMLVSANPQGDKIEIRFVKSPKIYELESVFRHTNDAGTQVECTFTNSDKSKSISFANLFNTFQFLQQVRFFERIKLAERCGSDQGAQIETLVVTWNMARLH